MGREESFRNNQNFRQKNERQNSGREEQRQGSSFGEESQSQSEHSPTSSSGLTIEEFLTRYPEGKRLSSRFGDDPPNTERPFKLNHKKQNKHNKKKNKNNRNNHQAQQQQQQQQQLLQH